MITLRQKFEADIKRFPNVNIRQRGGWAQTRLKFRFQPEADSITK